jgi:hypothetical protein
LPLTSKEAARVAEIFPEAPVIARGQINNVNVRYHLGRAYMLLHFLADELTSQIKRDDDCEIDDKDVVAAYEAWHDIAFEAERLLDQAWRFDRKSRELMNCTAEIRVNPDLTKGNVADSGTGDDARAEIGMLLDRVPIAAVEAFEHRSGADDDADDASEFVAEVD